MSSFSSFFQGLWGKKPMAKAPWIIEAEKVLGWHEIRDHSKLSTWLKSEGKTLGDPSKLPWCGDFVDTVISLALPKEPRPGKLGENPYWALNWEFFGVPVVPSLYCVAYFVRSKGGHVGFLVGEDDTRYYVLGGNQGDSVSVVPIEKNRLRGTRWPSTYVNKPLPLPRMTSSSSSSKNEA